LWKALCINLTKQELFNPEVGAVPWPKNTVPGDTHESQKDCYIKLHDWHRFVTQCELGHCMECQELVDVAVAFRCEGCGVQWCDNCGERGPDKRFVPCKICPDFSKSHCNECFHEGKTWRCECSHTDSWHSCCGRCGFNCPKCDAMLCDGCEDRHECEGGEEDEEDN